jgi:hypothetical protein
MGPYKFKKPRDVELSDYLVSGHSPGAVAMSALGHKRKSETSGQHRLWTIQLSHQAPIARVTTVSGIPARQYAQKEIWKPAARARSATIRFATEPTGVRPAKVARFRAKLRSRNSSKVVRRQAAQAF